MGYEFAPVGERTERCGYRIQPVEDVPHDMKAVLVKGPDWYAFINPDDWAPYAAIVDDNEFAAKVLALALEIQLGIPVECTGWPGKVGVDV